MYSCTHLPLDIFQVKAGSRAPKSWSQPVGGQPPSRQHLSLVFGLLVNSQQRLSLGFVALVKNCGRALIWDRFWNPILVNIIGGWRWQLEYKSEYLLFSSYRQAAWSERMTSCLSILFICCHFLRWSGLLCQIPIDRQCATLVTVTISSGRKAAFCQLANQAATS